MGYLNNVSVTVDAILTKKGRELLANGGGLNITKFALGDDEIDYSLYEPAHPKGSAFYDAAIKAIPITEASPDETQSLKYKLMTLPKNTQILPIITLAESSVNLNLPGATSVLSPQTTNISNGNAALGYTFTIANADILTLAADTLPAQSNIVNTTHTPNGNQSSHTVVV